MLRADEIVIADSLSLTATACLSMVKEDDEKGALRRGLVSSLFMATHRSAYHSGPGRSVELRHCTCKYCRTLYTAEPHTAEHGNSVAQLP